MSCLRWWPRGRPPLRRTTVIQTGGLRPLCRPIKTASEKKTRAEKPATRPGKKWPARGRPSVVLQVDKSREDRWRMRPSTHRTGSSLFCSTRRQCAPAGWQSSLRPNPCEAIRPSPRGPCAAGDEVGKDRICRRQRRAILSAKQLIATINDRCSSRSQGLALEARPAVMIV